jgi:probable HAF family extracellular repeat protein
MISRKFLLAAAGCAVSIAANAAPPTWTIAEIGSFGTNISQGTALNNRGQVVGTSNKIILPFHWAGISRCLLWENGAMQDIGTPEFDFCQALGISDNGTILAATGYAGKAYLYKDGQWTLAGPSSPSAMNRFNAIAGNYWNGAGYRGYYARDGAVSEIGTLGGNLSNATSVNDKGYVVGSASVNDMLGIGHAYVWKDGVMRDLGTLRASRTAMPWTSTTTARSWVTRRRRFRTGQRSSPT